MKQNNGILPSLEEIKEKKSVAKLTSHDCLALNKGAFLMYSRHSPTLSPIHPSIHLRYNLHWGRQ